MKTNLKIFLTMLFLCAPVLAIGAEKSDANKGQLDSRQQAIIPISALTANGEIDRLKPALHQGLDAGLTINEIKEALVHIYAYSGFPRSLNGLAALLEVVKERKQQGIEDVVGKEASPVPVEFDKDAYGAEVRAKLAGLETDIANTEWQQFTPVIDTFLKEHLFADIFVCDVLSHQQRELVTIATLANMSGTEGQLYFHLGAAMNTGLTAGQLQEFVAVLNRTVGEAQAESAQEVLNAVLSARK